MAKNVKVKLNMDELNKLMKSQEMQDVLDRAGQAVAANAGEGYEKRTHEADFTAICNVYPNSAKAAKDNYEHNTLLRAVSNVGLPTRKPRL